MQNIKVHKHSLMGKLPLHFQSKAMLPRGWTLWNLDSLCRFSLSTTLKPINQLCILNVTIVLADFLTNPDYSTAPQRMNHKEFEQNTAIFEQAHNSWNLNCPNI